MNKLLKPKTKKGILEDFESLNFKERFDLLIKQIRIVKDSEHFYCSTSYPYEQADRSYIRFQRWFVKDHKPGIVRTNSRNIFDGLFLIKLEDESIKIFYDSTLVREYSQLNYTTFKEILDYFSEVVDEAFEKAYKY